MRVRDGEIEFRPEMTDALLSSLDTLGQLLEALPEVTETDISHHIQELTELTTAAPPAVSDAPGEDGAAVAPVEDDAAPSAELEFRAPVLDHARRHGRNVFRIDVPADKAQGEAGEALVASLGGIADIHFDGVEGDTRVIGVSSPLDAGILAAELGVPADHVKPVDLPDRSGNATADATPEAPAAAPEAKDAAPEARDAAPEANAAPGGDSPGGAEAKPAAKESTTVRRSDPAAETVRVPVHLLDRLMDQAGELVLSRNQLLRAFSQTTDSGVKSILQDLDLITSEIQGDIMNTRMQPVGVVFTKFNRIVRDLSRSLDKEVRLDIEGSDVELDKSIIELLSDPLTHLIRNSLDHGIEGPSDRLAADKDRKGTVNLRAFHEGGQVHIEIEDDGAGIDPARMREVAISKGVITREEAFAMPDADARMLIFAPGFSTAGSVSNVSGRGVGMDVVKTNIGKLGGKIDVESQIGAGTKITIALPLTLAIIPSLIVEAANERLAIPQVNLVELVRVKAADLDRIVSKVNGAPVLRLRGNLLPLVPLREVLGVQDDELPDCVTDADDHEPSDASGRVAMNVVVLQVGGTHFGLTVDSIRDSEEIVVKPLSHLLDGSEIYSGATIMGDGQVAMILDAAGIANHATLRLEEKKVASRADDEDATAGRIARRRLVLFTNASDEQFGIDLERLVRLERISVSEIEEVGDQLCIQYLGQGLPLVRLHEELPVRPIVDDSEEYFVLIPKVEGRPRGILAGGIVDAVEAEFELDDDSAQHSAIEGRAAINGQLTLLIDPEHLGTGNSEVAA